MLTRKAGALAGIIATALLFTALHGLNSEHWMGPLLLVTDGAYSALVRLRSGSLLLPAAFHIRALRIIGWHVWHAVLVVLEGSFFAGSLTLGVGSGAAACGSYGNAHPCCVTSREWPRERGYACGYIPLRREN